MMDGMDHHHQHNHGVGGGGDGTAVGGGMPHMMMQMSFTAGSQVTILFSGWKTTNAGQLFGSVIFIILLGIGYEGLKFWRERLAAQNLARQTSRISGQVEGGGPSRTSGGDSFLDRHHLIQTSLHLIQVAVGYLLMLIAMTYNVWCFLAVILGSTLGYFFVGWKRYSISSFSDHCT